MNGTLSRRVFLKMAAVTTAGAWLAACQAPAPTATTRGSGSEPVKPREEESSPLRCTDTRGSSSKWYPFLMRSTLILRCGSSAVKDRGIGRSCRRLWQAARRGTASAGDQAHALNWGPKGAIVNVADLIAQDTEYPPEGYIPGVVDAYNVGGSVDGVPTWCLTMWMYYNKNMFDEAGLAYPTPEMTWDEYVATAEKLTKREGDRITQFGAAGWQSWTFPVAQLVWSNGGHFYYNDDLTKVAVDDPKTVAVLQDLADLVHVQKVSCRTRPCRRAAR